MLKSLRDLSATLRRRAPLSCSFCGRAAADVNGLVAGASAYICDTCVGQCAAILDDHGITSKPPLNCTH